MDLLQPTGLCLQQWSSHCLTFIEHLPSELHDERTAIDWKACTLIKCLNAISDKHRRIPFRRSQLERLYDHHQTDCTLEQRKAVRLTRTSPKSTYKTTTTLDDELQQWRHEFREILLTLRILSVPWQIPGSRNESAYFVWNSQQRLLLLHLFQKKKNTYNLEVQTFFWSDSTIELHWLSDTPSRWKTFVVNRLSEVQYTTIGGFWDPVPGCDRAPGGKGSKQLRKLNNCTRWIVQITKTPLFTRPTKTFHLRASNKDAAHNLCLAVIVLCLTLGSCIDSKIPIQFKPC